MSRGSPYAGLTWTQRCVLGTGVLTLAPAAIATGIAAKVPIALAVVVATCATVLLIRIPTEVVSAETESQPRRWLLMLAWIGLSLFGGYKLASLSVFMLDVDRVEHAGAPPIRDFADPEMAVPFFPTHNCFTCYIVAAHVAGERVENIYDRSLYRNPEIATPIHDTIGDKLHVDRYQYPPPFLVLPKLLMATRGDFFQLRTYWFTLNVFALFAVVSALTVWSSGPEFSIRWLAWPLITCAPCILLPLQMENAHMLMIVIPVGAMLAFERRWHWLGGPLLAFAVVSKLFPGVLLAYLLLQKRFRAVAWTLAAMGAYCVIALILFGAQPFTAFWEYQMPRLASGEAFSFAFERLRPMLLNSSVMGIAYKLGSLDLVTDPAGLAKLFNWILTGVLGIAVLVFALRGPRLAVDDDDQLPADRPALARIWLALLVLAQLRSPFLPWAYGNVAPLLLLTLMIPIGALRWRHAVFLVPAFLMLAVAVPLPYGSETITLDLVHTLTASATIIVICLVIVVRAALPRGQTAL